MFHIYDITIQGSLKLVHLQIYHNFMNGCYYLISTVPGHYLCFHCLVKNINSQGPKYDFLTIQFIFYIFLELIQSEKWRQIWCGISTNIGIMGRKMQFIFKKPPILAYIVHGPWDYHANSLKGQSHVVRGVAARVFCFQFCDIKNLVKFCTQKKKKLIEHTNEKINPKFCQFLLKKYKKFPQEK